MTQPAGRDTFRTRVGVILGCMPFISKSVPFASGLDKGSNLSSLLALTRTAGPYLAMALLLPGGSVIALLAWLYRRRT